MANRIFVRGDTHGVFDFLPYFCQDNQTDRSDILVILGDAGILYWGANSAREQSLKQYISEQPITLFCVRGNHEDRPSDRAELTYIGSKSTLGDAYYVDPNYSNILYAVDGGEYSIYGKRILTIGGAYSVDKYYRLSIGYKWVQNEELSKDERAEIFNKVKGNRYDLVFTHTCPSLYMPTDLFLPSIDQDTVSKDMERFLSEVQNNIKFSHWYFGHYHADRSNIYDTNFTMLFNEVEQIV